MSFFSTVAYCDREISGVLPYVSYYWIHLHNPSSKDIDVDIVVDAKGSETVGILDPLKPTNYRLCSGVACGSYFAPNSDATTCPTNKSCQNAAGYKTIPKNGGVLTMGFGANLNTAVCYYGCVNMVKTTTDSQSGLVYRITVKGDLGYLTGVIETEGHYSTGVMSYPLNSGRPF